ncbi:MAG: Gar1/Naf1 family protein [Candidatus Bathyarchaeia archaeon]
MKRLGYVLHQSNNRNLILRSKSNAPPELGAKVYDAKRRPLGIVVDVFGPVKSPYIEVKPLLTDAGGLVGRSVYVRVERERA